MLTVSDSLSKAFLNVSSNIRLIRAEIVGECITLCSNPTMVRTSSPQTDFATLSQEKVSPRYYLWNASPNSWVLIAFVNENTCKVRDKMLYASSHRSLVDTLGSSLFIGQFYCNLPEEFTYDGIEAAIHSSVAGAPLTEAEEGTSFAYVLVVVFIAIRSVKTAVIFVYSTFCSFFFFFSSKNRGCRIYWTSRVASWHVRFALPADRISNRETCRTK